MLDGLVVFPDGYEEYRALYADSATHSRSVPFYVCENRLVERNGQRRLEHQVCVEVPWIPLRNGFIHGHDDATGLPNAVGDQPSEAHWGAYYWVRPKGCRIAVMGIGVIDPMETNGFALWWGPKESSPLLSIRPAKVASPELKQQMKEAVAQAYVEEAGRWRKPTSQ